MAESVREPLRDPLRAKLAAANTALLDAWAAGNWPEVVRLTESLVRRSVARAGVRRQEDVEGVAQAVWAEAARCDPRTLTLEPRHWFAIVARRRAIDHLRSVYRSGSLSSVPADSHAALSVIDERSTEALPRTLVRLTVARVFRALDPRARLVLWSRVVDREDLATVARRLGVSTSRARQVSKRALQDLRSAWVAAHPTDRDLVGTAPLRRRTRPVSPTLDDIDPASDWWHLAQSWDAPQQPGAREAQR